MGSGISDNYSDIKPIFTARYWKVHSAIKKSTGESFSLWLLDVKDIKKRVSKTQLQKYIDSCIESVNKLRRLHHPNILKIYEVSENPKEFGFSAEPVDNTLFNDQSLNSDDITYIADQLSQVLAFIHENAKLLHLGLTPDSICLTKSVKIKLFDFNYSTPYDGTSNPISPSFGEYVEDCVDPEICYTAPEYLEHKQVTASADIFSYGALLFAVYNNWKPVYFATTTEEVIVTVQAEAFKTPTNMSEPMHALLSQCMKYNPEERPSLSDILKSPAYYQLSIRSLRYLGLLATKDPADRYNFFQGIVQSLPLFSQRLLEYNLLPTFVEELKNNDNYGPVLIPVIFKIGSKMSSDDFMNSIIRQLPNIFLKFDPPGTAIATLQHLEIIIQKVPEDLQYKLLYPLFIGSLQSRSKELRDEAIKVIPIMINTLSESAILTSLLPTLLDFIANFTEIEMICSVIYCISKCSEKVNGDKFAYLIMPKLMICWVRQKNNQVASAIIDLLETLTSSSPTKMKFIVPMACAIISSTEVQQDLQLHVCDFIASIVNDVKKERNLDERAINWRPADIEKEDCEIQAPVKVEQLDLDKIEEYQRRRSSMNDGPSNQNPNPSASPQQPINDQPYNHQQGGNITASSLGNDGDGSPEKKKPRFSLFGFGKRKSTDDAENPPPENHTQPPMQTGMGSYGNTNDSAPAPQYKVQPTVAPRGGPPGPLPPTHQQQMQMQQQQQLQMQQQQMQQQQQQAYMGPTVAPRGGPPGPLPPTHQQQMQMQQQQQQQMQQQPSYVAPRGGPPGPLPPTHQQQIQMQQQQQLQMQQQQMQQQPSYVAPRGGPPGPLPQVQYPQSAPQKVHFQGEQPPQYQLTEQQPEIEQHSNTETNLFAGFSKQQSGSPKRSTKKAGNSLFSGMKVMNKK